MSNGETHHAGSARSPGQPGRRKSSAKSFHFLVVTPGQHGGGSGLGASRSRKQVVVCRDVGDSWGQGRHRARKTEGWLGAGEARTGSMEKALVPRAWEGGAGFQPSVLGECHRGWQGAGRTAGLPGRKAGPGHGRWKCKLGTQKGQLQRMSPLGRQNREVTVSGREPGAGRGHGSVRRRRREPASGPAGALRKITAGLNFQPPRRRAHDDAVRT